MEFIMLGAVDSMGGFECEAEGLKKELSSKIAEAALFIGDAGRKAANLILNGGLPTEGLSLNENGVCVK